MAMTSSMETLVVVNLKNREAIFEQFAVISLSFSSCGRNIFICKKDWEVTLMIRICRRIGLTVTARPDLWDDERYHIIIAKESDIMSLMQVNIRAFTGFYFYMIDNKKIDIRAIAAGRNEVNRPRVFIFKNNNDRLGFGGSWMGYPYKDVTPDFDMTSFTTSSASCIRNISLFRLPISSIQWKKETCEVQLLNDEGNPPGNRDFEKDVIQECPSCRRLTVYQANADLVIIKTSCSRKSCSISGKKASGRQEQDFMQMKDILREVEDIEYKLPFGSSTSQESVETKATTSSSSSTDTTTTRGSNEVEKQEYREGTDDTATAESAAYVNEHPDIDAHVRVEDFVIPKTRMIQYSTSITESAKKVKESISNQTTMHPTSDTWRRNLNPDNLSKDAASASVSKSDSIRSERTIIKETIEGHHRPGAQVSRADAAGVRKGGRGESRVGWRDGTRTPCRHWKQTSTCRFGDRCRFQHL